MTMRNPLNARILNFWRAQPEPKPSFSEVGRAFGVSRNQVAGVVHRAGESKKTGAFR